MNNSSSSITSKGHDSSGILDAIATLNSDENVLSRSVSTFLTSALTWETIDSEDAYALFVGAEFDPTVEKALFPTLPVEPVTISQLPVELLIRIFEGIHPPETWSVNHLQTLASVTKQWHSVVTSTASLWAVAKYCGPSSSSIDQVTLALKKSKKAPLSVICNVESRVPNSDIRPFIQVIIAEAYRWRSASFSTRSALLVSLYLNDLPMPMIERFSYANWMTRHTAIRIGGGGRLRDLTLIGSVPAMKNLDVLSHLEIICLDSIPLAGDRLRQILSSCSALQILFLNRLKDGGSNSEEDPQVIRLNHLRILSLTTVSLSTMRIVMSIVAENLTKLRFKSLQDSTSQEFLNSLAQPRSGLQSHVTAALRQTTKLNISVNDSEEVGVISHGKTPVQDGGESLAGGGNVTGQSSGLSILLTGTKLDVVWNRLKSYIAENVPITLDVTHRFTGVPFDPALLHSMRCLTSLQLQFTHPHSDGQRILSYLSEPSRHTCHSETPDCFQHDSSERRDQQCLSWPCPQLVDIKLSASAYRGDDENLVDFFTKRYGTCVIQDEQLCVTEETSAGQTTAQPQPALPTGIRIFGRKKPPTADVVSRISNVLVKAANVGAASGSSWKASANLHFS
ncbi:hypothetical protein FRB95_003301 [Tulasnella sp. JGI-2019a]|nr:hypothetical protein FRB95_003301 [Tulasnella sp. JGI-2019a]